MKAAGETVRLAPYDTALDVEPGDVVETTTGRRYLVEDARRGRILNGRGWYRWSLTCVVMAPDDVNPEGAVVHSLRWYSRNKRK